MSYIERARKTIMNTYKRNELVLVRGKGSYVYDDRGNRYLDFTGGIAVCSLGHCPDEVINAVENQIKTLIHTSNLYFTIPQIELAERLVNLSGGGVKVFFCNSGAEANEGAIKLARKYHRKKGKDKYEIITFLNSFHGRTYGSLSATGQTKFHKDFEPLLPGFKYAELNNIESVKSLLTPKTAGIMIELIQGEGGINVCNRDFLLELKSICDQQDILLIFDEIQTGVGRTGRFFCYEHFEIKPHIWTLAKGIAGGLPLGAIIALDEIAQVLEPGTHATTFGGGPVICSAGCSVVDRISNKEFLQDVEKKGKYLEEGLEKMKSKYPFGEIRGMGLLRGVELKIDEPAKVVDRGLKNGLLLNITAGNILRLLPPLNIKVEEIDEFFDKISKTFDEVL
ncbi:MAG: aspartate aminotransferase family protein [Proteobacteria bacterium]|nr:aspartate aminotransferase family protein [Pseudomonadota bacterium]